MIHRIDIDDHVPRPGAFTKVSNLIYVIMQASHDHMIMIIKFLLFQNSYGYPQKCDEREFKKIFRRRVPVPSENSYMMYCYSSLRALRFPPPLDDGAAACAADAACEPPPVFLELGLKYDSCLRN